MKSYSLASSNSKCSLIGDGNGCPETEFEDFPIIPARSYRFDSDPALTPNEDGEVSFRDPISNGHARSMMLARVSQ